MTEPDPLADVFPGTADAPLPVIAGWWGAVPVLGPHPDDPRWTPTKEVP